MVGDLFYVHFSRFVLVTDTFLAFAKREFPFFSHGSGNAQIPGRKTADVKHETGIGYA